jgi:hypothetical protein
MALDELRAGTSSIEPAPPRRRNTEGYLGTTTISSGRHVIRITRSATSITS